MINITLRADTSRLNRKLRTIKAASAAARPQAAAQVASTVVRILDRAAPSDTGRYRRAWVGAHNQLPGISPMPLPPLGVSKYYRQNHARIRAQALHWARILDQWRQRVRDYERRNGHTRWPSYQEAKRILAKVEKINARAQAALEALETSGGEGAIVIGGRAGKDPLSVSRLSRVSIGGAPLGQARRLSVGSRDLWELTNREPHAKLVERRSAALAKALILARPAGLVAARGALRSAIRKGVI